MPGRQDRAGGPTFHQATDLPGELAEFDGRYVVERELGRGGMGRVFAARDLKLDRRVAVKLLAPGEHRSEELRRFEQEARLAGSLDHPNILAIHDIGGSASAPFIVSELLDGATLGARMAGKPLPVAKAVDYALQIAGGLCAAHGKGIVHRDLKPENLFITHEGRLKILDFGIAKLMAQAPSTERATASGAILGTVTYMSPEQVRGKPADERSDIFSFGSILYEMLAGKAAFDRGSPLETGHAILSEEPPGLPAGVPLELDRIVRRCLEKEPADRFQSAGDLSAELARFTSFAGSEAAPSRKVRRRAMLAAGLAVAAAAVFLLVRGRPDREPPRAERPSIAVLPFVNLSSDKENEYFSDGMTEELINALANVEGIRVASRTSAFAFKGASISVRKIGAELQVATILEGSVRREGSNVRVVAQLVDVKSGYHLWSATYDHELKSVFALEEELARAIVKVLEPKLALRPAPKPASAHAEREPTAREPPISTIEPDPISLDSYQRSRTAVASALVRPATTSPEAHDLYLQARYFWHLRTEADLRAAMALFERAIARDPDYALAYAGLSQCYLLLQDFGAIAAAEARRSARLAALDALRIDESTADAHASLCRIASEEYDWGKADRECSRAIELSPRSAGAHAAYAAMLLSLGRLASANGEATRATELDPAAPRFRTLLGMTLYYARDYDGAIEAYRAALERGPTLFAARARLGQAYVQKGRYAEALTELEAAKRLGAKDVDGLLGYAYAVAGQRDAASRVLAELDPRLVRTFEARALIHLGLGENDRAVRSLESALAADATLQFLNVDPWFDPLRSDPRFSKILRAMHLE